MERHAVWTRTTKVEKQKNKPMNGQTALRVGMNSSCQITHSALSPHDVPEDEWRWVSFHVGLFNIGHADTYH